MKIEIRGNEVYLDGYVNAVERDSRELPNIDGTRFVEQIKSGAWKRAIAASDNVDLLYNHREDRKLGSIKEGNLELQEDNIGLRAKCRVSDPEIIDKAKRGLLTGWSFEFRALKDNWEKANSIQRRYIEELELFEVSILSITPAYYGTSIEARDEETLVKEKRATKDKSEEMKDNSKDEEEEDKEESKKDEDNQETDKDESKEDDEKRKNKKGCKSSITENRLYDVELAEIKLLKYKIL